MEDNLNFLFGEGMAHILFTAKPDCASAIAKRFKQLPLLKVGKVTEAKELKVSALGKVVANIKLDELAQSFKRGLL